MCSRRMTLGFVQIKKKGAKLNDIVLNLSFDYDLFKLGGPCFSFAFSEVVELKANR